MTYTVMPGKQQPLRVVPIALALLVGILGASVLAGQLAVTSLPYTVNQSAHSASTWDTVTISGSRLTSTTSGITFGGSTHHWMVLLRTGTAPDTIIFGTDSTVANTRGIALGAGSHDIIIRGGCILHRPANIPLNYNGPYIASHEVNAGARAISLSNGYNILVDSILRAEVIGYGLQTHVIAGGGKMMTIDRCRLFNNCYAFTQRDLFQATCVKSEGLDNNILSPGEFHYRITNCYLSDNAHTNVYFAYDKVAGHYAVVQMDGDTLYQDLRNKRYTAISGMYQSTTNGYAIDFTRAGPGSYIKNCVVTPGSSYEGGRGILLTHCVGTQSNPVEVAYNKIWAHNGPNTEYGGLSYNCVAVKLRQHNTGVWLHHNVITVTADTTTTLGATSYLPSGVALWIQPQYEAGGTSLAPYYLTIENNVCSAKVVTNVNNSNYDLTAVNFETLDSFDPSIIYRNNRIYSQGNFAYTFGQYDGGANYVQMSGDTVTLVSNSLTPKVTFNPGDYRGSHDHWATDFYYLSPATFSVGYYYGGGPTGSGAQNISIRRTISIYVKGSNGQPVTNATVTVRNAYNQSVLSGATNNGGRLSGPVSYRFESRTGTDSAAFNNFTATATSGTDNTSLSFAVNWNSYRDTLTLTRTTGTGTWETGDVDVTPPNQILDLGAEPGSSSGTITLTWTAPGDDNIIGYADHYLVRYSLDPMDEANWGAAILAGAPPIPAAAGARQSMTLGGLSPGVDYFVGIVAVDEAGNRSALSNITSAQAKISVVTGGDSVNVTKVEPTDYAVIADAKPTLVILNVDTVASSVYWFQVATDSGFANVVASSGAVPQRYGLQTSWRVSPALESHRDYYWHVRRNDAAYGGFAAFTVEVEARAYPNPFRLAEGSQVTFAGIPAGSNLLLMTSSGDTIRRWASTNGSDIVWDGRNESGQPVASGIYLWYVKSSDIKGKLIVIR